jgi:hypothetical protein
MAGKDTLADIAEQLGLALEPLDGALQTEEMFSAFMRHLGWDTAGYIAEVRNLGSIITGILNAVEDGLDASQAATVIGQIVNFFSAVSKLSSATGLPGTMDPVDFANDFPGQLTDYLVAQYLLSNQPTLGAVLLAAGVIRKTDIAATGKRLAYTRLDIAWSDVGNLLNDPLGTVRNAYAWGPSFAQQTFLANMEHLGRALGLTVFYAPVIGPLKTLLTQGATSTTILQDFVQRWQMIGDLVAEADFGMGLEFYALPPTASAAPGFALLPYVEGDVDTTMQLSDDLSLVVKAQFDVDGGVLVEIRQSQPLSLTTGFSGGGAGAAASAFSATLLEKSPEGSKRVLLGTEGASRLENHR